MVRSVSLKSASMVIRVWLCLSLTIATVLAGVILPPRRTKRGGNHNNFYFKKYPLVNHVESGQSVRLRCGVNVKRNIQYHWILDNRQLVFTSRRYQDGSDLYISNADRKLDTGVFKCVATNSSSKYSIVSKGYSVKIYQMDPNVSVDLVRPRQLSEIREGGQVELKCKTKAYPPVTDKKILWYHNFRRLKGQSAIEKRIAVLPNGNLLINAYQRGNAGVYRCQVLHPAGDVMTNKPLAIATGDDSPYYKVSTDPTRYLRYFRRNDIMKLECPVEKHNNVPGFINWSYRQRLDLSSVLRNFDNSRSCSKGDCLLPKEKFALQRKPSGGQSWTGFYMCQVIANGTFSKHYVIEVRRAENPNLNATNFGLRRPSERIVPILGKNYTLRVFIDLTPKKRTQQMVADPIPKFQWFTPSGANIPASGSRLRIINGRDLFFDDVRLTDSGTYTFSASNEAGVQKWRVNVAVTFPPTLKSTPMQDREILEGDRRVSFRCNVASRAKPPISKIVWKKDGSPINQTNGRIVINHKAGILTFNVVSMSEKGDYQCVVETRYLEDVPSNVFKIKVLKRLRIMVTDPQPFLERGIQGKLTCLASGESPITFEWFRADFRNRNRFKRIRRESGRYQIEREVSGKSVLVIHSIADDDAGAYMCRATDNRMTSRNTTYQVVVGEKPEITKSTTKNITTFEGQNFRLDCTGIGDPAPKTSWIRRRIHKEAESLTLDSFISYDPKRSRRFLFGNGTLLVRSAEFRDEGVYQCIVGHKHAIVSGPEIHVRVKILNGGSSPNGDGQYRRRSPLTKTILIVVGCALAYLGLIIALTVYCSIRMMRKRRKYTETVVVGPTTKADLAAVTAAESQSLMANGDNTFRGTMNPGQVSPSVSMFYRPYDTTSNVSSAMEAQLPPPYPRDRLVKIATLGKGEFGEILLARAPMIGSNNEIRSTEMLVSVITLQTTKDRRIVEDFQAQIEMYGKLDHRSVAKLAGVFFEKEPRCFLLEYSLWGDLKQFLHAIRRGHPGQPSSLPMGGHLGSPDSPNVQSLSYSQRMHICSQVANGMEHISNLRYVHKDLAARNILLSPNLDVKISNIGLCHSTYSEDYFPLRLVHRGANPSFRTGRMIPLRWMPPEVIINGAFSPETDIWSYAIFVYEVLSLGETPLRKHTHSEIVMAACAHHLVPELPPSCTPELQTLLMRCWSEQPSERPSFSEISVLIGGMVVECDV